MDAFTGGVTLSLAVVVRSISGWLENALQDGKITIPEWKKLAETLFRMFVPFMSLTVGFGVAPLEAAFMALLFDVLVVKLAKLIDMKKKKKKRTIKIG